MLETLPWTVLYFQYLSCPVPSPSSSTLLLASPKQQILALFLFYVLNHLSTAHGLCSDSKGLAIISPPSDPSPAVTSSFNFWHNQIFPSQISKFKLRVTSLIQLLLEMQVCSGSLVPHCRISRSWHTFRASPNVCCLEPFNYTKKTSIIGNCWI